MQHLTIDRLDNGWLLEHSDGKYAKRLIFKTFEEIMAWLANAVELGKVEPAQ